MQPSVTLKAFQLLNALKGLGTTNLALMSSALLLLGSSCVLYRELTDSVSQRGTEQLRCLLAWVVFRVESSLSIEKP